MAAKVSAKTKKCLLVVSVVFQLVGTAVVKKIPSNSASTETISSMSVNQKDISPNSSWVYVHIKSVLGMYWYTCFNV